MIKRIVAALLAIICLLLVTVTACAHPKEGNKGHDQYMSWILFGSKTYKDTLSAASREYKAIEALENAVALCLDRYTGIYKNEHKKLQAINLPTKLICWLFKQLLQTLLSQNGTAITFLNGGLVCYSARIPRNYHRLNIKSCFGKHCSIQRRKNT